VEAHNNFKAWLGLHFAVNAGMVSQALIHKESSEQLVSSSRELASAAHLGRKAVHKYQGRWKRDS
jgi:hypothetical protein